MKYCILTPRFPFPENGGDVLRINHVARYLKQQGHQLCLVSFRQAETDMREATQLYDSIYTVPLTKMQSYFYSLIYWLTGKPMQCGYYHSSTFEHTLQAVIEKEHPDMFVAHLLRMTPYLESLGLQAKSIVEMTDALSKTYALAGIAQGRSWMKLIYRLEQQHIKQYEQQVVNTFPKVVLVSQQDADYLQAQCPTVSSIVCHSNGVKCLPAIPTSYSPLKLCFVGNMRTLQNQDAVLHFVKHVFPAILKHKPDASFYIVGAEPPAHIRALANEHIIVTGFVPDVQTTIQNACVMVASVQVAAGIQNKVLVAMGCGVPVVMTSLIARAIPEVKDGENALIADDADAMVKVVLQMITNADQRNKIGQAGYQMVMQNYSWLSKLQGYEQSC